MTAFNLEVLLLLLVAFALGLVLGLWLRRVRRRAAESEVMVPVPSNLPPTRANPPAGDGAGPAPSGQIAGDVTGEGVRAEDGVQGTKPTAVEPMQPALRPLREPVADLFGHLLNVPAGAIADDPEPPPRRTSPIDRAGANHPGVRPPVLTEPEGGAADDLKCLKGIGPQNERRLHALGIFHFRQIATWTPDEAAWVGSYLAFPGRIEREDWIGQAQALVAKGDDGAPDKPAP